MQTSSPPSSSSAQSYGGTQQGYGGQAQSSSSILPSGKVLLTRTLYRGLRHSEVRILQQFLTTQGDLAGGNTTSYFGPLTEAALKKYQCRVNIICSGSPYTTGWGRVGPLTRKKLGG